MPELLTSIGYSTLEWTGIIIAALLIGISRTAISGLAILVIPLLAGIFGGRASTGVILPMLVVADLYAIYHFRNAAHRPTIARILPWAMLGLVLGVSVGGYIDDRHFKMTIGLIVLVCILIILYTGRRGAEVKPPLSARGMFILQAVIGTAAGFSSMIGNAAGPIFWIYLISCNLGKSSFMGTSAWFFFMMNATKLPLQILVWNNISARNIIPSIMVVPVILGGAYAGTFIIKHINEKPFRYLVLGMAMVASINLIVR
ncbi:MAG: sulfite exporter TauE/SafE family protein [Spirochaetia bacterium]|nr:sulfite exporter TauE/SafE family protein [Spirochaetia bacterium]